MVGAPDRVHTHCQHKNTPHPRTCIALKHKEWAERQDKSGSKKGTQETNTQQTEHARATTAGGTGKEEAARRAKGTESDNKLTGGGGVASTVHPARPASGVNTR